MPRSSPIAEPEASVVRDVLGTVSKLRRASEAALKARQLPPRRASSMAAVQQADAYVRELTGRVQSRARSAGMAENALLALAYDVLERRRHLPPPMWAHLEAAE